MPTSLPVPSRGALRALRQLALGASCTVAVSAGLLTEDRRRRINTAREVHTNAKKLKSARQYHNAGAVTIETFEDQALRYSDDAFWLPSNVLRDIEHSIRPGGRSSQNHYPFQKYGQDALEDTEYIRPSTPQSKSRTKTPRIQEMPIPIKYFNGMTSQAASLPVYPPRAKEAGAVVNMGTDLLAARVASLKHHRALDGSLSQESVDIATCLRNDCRKQGRIDLADQVLDITFPKVTRTKRQFHLVDPEYVISRLLYSGNGILPPDTSSVRKAASIFLESVTILQEIMSETTFALGSSIYSEAIRLDIHDIVVQIFYRLESCRGDRPPPDAQHVIKALYDQGLHRKVLSCFRNFSKHALLSQNEFSDVCHMVISSAIKVQQSDLAEQALVTASHIGKTSDLVVPNIFVLRVLHQDWRSYHDIVRTRALFDRLESIISSLQDPLEVHARIMQYCVEARDHDATKVHYDRIKRLLGAVDDARIHGVLALAKAYEGDWDGVLKQFERVDKAHFSNQKVFGHSFAPVLKEYAKCHSLTETEHYINLFTTTFGLKINKFIMNFMVSVYGKEAEIDSMARWIKCSITDGCLVDHHTINNILRKCHYTWRFSFQQIFKLFSLIRKADESTTLRSSDTMVFLRQLALKTRDPSTSIQLLQKHDNHSSDPQGLYRSMATTYAKRDYFTVLKLYKRAQKRQILLGQQHLMVAVKASLRYHEGNVDETTHLIKEAQRRKISIRSAISTVFVYQTTRLAEDCVPSSRLIEVCSNAVTAFEHANIEIPLAIVTHTSSCLHRGGHYSQAIDIWNAMCSRLKIPPSSLDLASLTTLLNAYIGLQDPAGIRWIGQMLSSNQRLWPDAQFKGLLKDARRKTTRMIETRPCSDQIYEFRDSIVELLQKINVKRAATLEEQLEVRTKTIMIIEQAIADEKSRRAGYKPFKPESVQTSRTMEKSAEVKDGPSWEDVHVGMPIARLAGAA